MKQKTDKPPAEPKAILIPVTSDEFSTEPFRWRLVVPEDHALRKVFGTKGK